MMAPGMAPGLAALQARLSGLSEAVKAEVAEALGEVAADVIEEARRALGGGESSGFGKRQASAPGGPPADPSGALAASLSAALETAEPQVTITAASPHAAFLEYGTRTMAARPFLRPAIAATSVGARTRLRAALARAAKTLGDSP